MLKFYVLEEKSIEELMQTRFYEAKNVPENRDCPTFLVEDFCIKFKQNV